MTAALRLGTRRSALATAQSERVADAITRAHRPGRRARAGRRRTATPRREALAQIGGTGVFVSALRDALLAGDVDLAVHSLKDLPTADADGLLLAAVPPREDPRDVLVARDGLDARRAARRLPGRHRLAAPRRPAARPRPRPRGRGRPRQRRHPAPPGRRRRGRRRRPRPRRSGPARPPRRRHRGRSTPSRCFPPPARGRWRSSAAARTTQARPRSPTCSTCSTTPRPGSSSPRSAPCSPYWKPAARPLSGPSEKQPTASTDPELYLRAVVSPADGSASVRLSATGPLDEAARIGRDLAADLLAEGAADLMWERVP